MSTSSSLQIPQIRAARVMAARPDWVNTVVRPVAWGKEGSRPPPSPSANACAGLRPSPGHRMGSHPKADPETPDRSTGERKFGCEPQSPDPIIEQVDQRGQANKRAGTNRRYGARAFQQQRADGVLAGAILQLVGI